MGMNETTTAILDVAQELLETRGYNAFSIKDLAQRVDIRTSSIHYHFPTKGDLCRALIVRHRERIAQLLERIDHEALSPRKKLERFARLFQSTIEAGNRMCPFGMLAADAETLESESCAELKQSFDDLENWLQRTLVEGKRSKDLSFTGSARQEARFMLSALEGAMLVARAYQDSGRFEAVARHLVRKLVVSQPGESA